MRLTVALFFVAVSAAAQPPEVPHKMEFGGMTLTIRDDARREIQKDVNALTQSPRHHMIKVERARTYFPIIEKVFAEERVPDDFKYLVLQESALIADAVSVSNAVGFWQFKDFTAVEMGLRVDKEIDERLNLVSSTRAAARYIKKNNFYFNNWIYALQAYQMGAGGVMRSVSKDENGKKHMEITSATYWYVKKFLAHKVAFESSVSSPGQIKVVPYVNRSDRQLKDLAREIQIDEIELLTYNKWAKKGSIPGDRQYTVLIPMKGDGREPELPSQQVATTVPAPVAEAPKTSAVAAAKGRTRINGISAIRAEANETPAALAGRARVNVSEFLKWNDISVSDRLQPDTYYLLGKKRVRASEAYHKVETGDDLWKISQRYGVQIRKLKRYNRISDDAGLRPGTTVWLSSMKPKQERNARAADQGPIVQVENDRTFSWTADPSVSTATVSEELSRGPSTQSPATPNGEGESAGTVRPTLEETAMPEEQQVAVAETAAPAPLTTAASGPAQESQQLTVINTPPDSVGTLVVTTVTPGPVNRQDVHTVKTGETLYGIAHLYSVGVMELVDWNGLNLQDGIKPGQQLKLRDPEEQAMASVASVASIEHVVRSTDTLYSVARKYNVTIKELMEWNNKKDFNLAIGEKLIVKGR